MLLYTEWILEELLMVPAKSSVGEKLIRVPTAHEMPEKDGNLPV
jgi:hypothetical protein